MGNIWFYKICLVNFYSIIPSLFFSSQLFPLKNQLFLEQDTQK